MELANIYNKFVDKYDRGGIYSEDAIGVPGIYCTRHRGDDLLMRYVNEYGMHLYITFKLLTSKISDDCMVTITIVTNDRKTLSTMSIHNSNRRPIDDILVTVCSYYKEHQFIDSLFAHCYAINVEKPNLLLEYNDNKVMMAFDTPDGLELLKEFNMTHVKPAPNQPYHELIIRAPTDDNFYTIQNIVSLDNGKLHLHQIGDFKLAITYNGLIGISDIISQYKYGIDKIENKTISPLEPWMLTTIKGLRPYINNVLVATRVMERFLVKTPDDVNNYISDLLNYVE